MTEMLERNLGLSSMRATEAGALAAGRWMGRGDIVSADVAAVRAVYQVLNNINMDGRVVIGEKQRHPDHACLATGAHIGTGQGPEMDVIVDSVEGVRLLVEGLPGCVSVVALAPRDSMPSLRLAGHVGRQRVRFHGLQGILQV